MEGEKHILYNAGQRFYNQLRSNEANSNNCNNFYNSLFVANSHRVISSMMDLLTGV